MRAEPMPSGVDGAKRPSLIKPHATAALGLVLRGTSGVFTRTALAAGVYTVGRAADSQVVLLSPEARSTHWVLVVRDDSVEVYETGVFRQDALVRLTPNGHAVLVCGEVSMELLFRSPSHAPTELEGLVHLRQRLSPLAAPLPEGERETASHPAAPGAPLRASEPGFLASPSSERPADARDTLEDSARPCALQRTLPQRRVEATAPIPEAVLLRLQGETADRWLCTHTVAMPRRTPTPLPRRATRPPLPSRPVRAPAGRGEALQLFCELYWGEVRVEAKAFDVPFKQVVAAASDRAQLPLWGFSLPDESWTLAEAKDEGVVLYPPPGARVEARPTAGGEFEVVRAVGAARALKVKANEQLRLTAKGMSLLVALRPSPPRAPPVDLAALPRLPLALTGAFLAFFFLFAALVPEGSELPRGGAVSPVAVRLVMNKPPKPEPKKEKKKEEKKKRDEAAAPKRERAVRRPASFSSPAPASKKALAALDKLGEGPGTAKLLLSTTLSGPKGPGPALAGLGAPTVANLGLGGMPGRGGGTQGGELLRGAGGMGVGALGARGLGRGGSVQGTVARASGRALGVQGNIDRDAVARAVNAHLNEVRACYERALLSSPGLGGKLVLEWTLNTSGQVTAARAKSSTLPGNQVAACVLAALRGWAFPPARGASVIVSYPFLFNSVGS